MPEKRFGKCSWCEQERMLVFVIGTYENKLWCDWICGSCLDAARNNLTEEKQ
jgi:hypothetical protein